MPVDNMDMYEIANLQNLYFHGDNGFRRDSMFGGGYGAARNNSLLSTLDSHHRFLEANNAGAQQVNVNQVPLFSTLQSISPVNNNNNNNNANDNQPLVS